MKAAEAHTLLHQLIWLATVEDNAKDNPVAFSSFLLQCPFSEGYLKFESLVTDILSSTYKSCILPVCTVGFKIIKTHTS